MHINWRTADNSNDQDCNMSVYLKRSYDASIVLDHSYAKAKCWKKCTVETSKRYTYVLSP